VRTRDRFRGGSESVRVRDGSWLPVHHTAAAGASGAADVLAVQLLRMASGGAVRAAASGVPAVVVDVRPAMVEDWTIDAAGRSLVVAGRDSRTTTAGVWSLLRLLGHARLAPPAEWEIVPSLGAVVDVRPTGPVRQPLAFLDGLGDGCGLMPSQSARLTTWREQVGISDAGTYTAGHSWALYVAERSPPAGWRSASGNKLRADVPELVADFVDWTAGRVSGKVYTSVAAADGLAGWSEIPMSPSDAQVTIANACAAAGLNVAILAYGYMAPPPTVVIDPRVLVVVASAYMQGIATEAEVLAGYYARGARLFACYGYPHVWTWEGRDLPGGQRAGLRSDLELEIGRLRRAGFLGWFGEAGCSWGANGRGCWSFAGVATGDDPLARWDRFPRIAFPSAPASAEAVFAELAIRTDDYTSARSGAVRSLVRDLLDATPPGTAERTRAVDLGRWAVAAELWRAYWAARSAATLDPWLRWSARCRERDMSTYRCAYADPSLATDRAAVAATFGITPGSNPGWADMSPFSPPWADSNSEPGEVEVRALL
jgi:hypothetical protein